MAATGQMYRPQRYSTPIAPTTYNRAAPAGHRTGHPFPFRLPPPLLMRRAGMPFADVPNVARQPHRTIPPTVPMAAIYALPPDQWRRQ